MPSQANITVKKADTTTDITYTAMQPSSGDGVQAVWKSTTVGSAAAHQPELRCSAKQVSGGKREVTLTFVYPSIATNTTTSTTSVVYREMGRMVMTLEPQAPSTDAAEATAQFANLLASTHVKAILLSMYGPT
jgi:hypothetical protein